MAPKFMTQEFEGILSEKFNSMKDENLLEYAKEQILDSPSFFLKTIDNFFHLPCKRCEYFESH